VPTSTTLETLSGAVSSSSLAEPAFTEIRLGGMSPSGLMVKMNYERWLSGLTHTLEDWMFCVTIPETLSFVADTRRAQFRCGLPISYRYTDDSANLTFAELVFAELVDFVIFPNRIYQFGKKPIRQNCLKCRCKASGASCVGFG
jgi:hypothetical protein